MKGSPLTPTLIPNFFSSGFKVIPPNVFSIINADKFSSLSILAKYHKIPFYVVAPSSTVDFSTLYGVKIKIEERSADEVLKINGKNIAPKGTQVRHPSFDITPASNITMIITEKGVYKPNKISTLKKVK